MKKSTGQKKLKKVFDEFEAGTLRSGSKKGPKVTSRKQAIAIALSEADKARYGRRFNNAARRVR